jgi:hypothetical protein
MRVRLSGAVEWGMSPTSGGVTVLRPLLSRCNLTTERISVDGAVARESGQAA